MWSSVLVLYSTLWSGFISQVLQERVAVSKLEVRFLLVAKLLTWKEIKFLPSLISISEPVGVSGDVVPDDRDRLASQCCQLSRPYSFVGS